MVSRPARRYPPDPAIISVVRSYAVDRLSVLKLGSLVEDVQILLTELITNVIMHAHTNFEVYLEAIGPGVRVEVTDDSPVMPVAGLPAGAALSGRGLMLVQSMATRWGAHRNNGGKTVWFELNPDAAPAPPVGDLDALLAMWSDSADNPSEPGTLAEVIVPDLDVRQLVAAKTHMEDLLREVQLVLLGNAQQPLATPRWWTLIAIAQRLDDAAKDFAEGRRQVRLQALQAAARGQDFVTLHLQLPPDAADAALRYEEAAQQAEALGGAGELLLSAEHLTEYAAIRRRYLDAVVEQLRARGTRTPVTPGSEGGPT